MINVSFIIPIYNVEQYVHRCFMSLLAQETAEAAAQAAQDPSVQEGQLLPDVIDQQKSNGGFMLDLSIGKSIRMKKGMLSINLSLSNILNNTKLCTGGYEQGRMNFSVNSETGETGSARLYKFDKNPKKFYAYGINGMLNISYRF